MVNSTQDHKYWLISFFIATVAIIILYSNSVYNFLKPNITRNEAITIAQKFLNSQDIHVNNFYKEAFLDNSNVEIRYLIKKLGNKKFEEFINRDKTNLSWIVMFHQDLPRQLEQKTFWVDVDKDGNVFGFRAEIPDTLKLNSISKNEAIEKISSYLKNRIGNEFNNYSLIEIKEEQLRNRTDFNFRWEKIINEPTGKYVITAKIVGDKVLSYSHYFEVPQKDRNYFTNSEAILGTTSVVFLILLIIYAFSIFLKKYHQGEVWISVGKTIFIIYFILALIESLNLWPHLGFGARFGDLQFSSVRLMLFLINGVIIQLFLGLLIFVSWSVGESYARSLWPEKLKSMDGLIKGHFFSIHTGSSLMKGLVIGTILSLTYLIGGIILNVPESEIYINPASYLEIYVGWLPSIIIVFGSFTTSILASIVLTFFIVTITYQKFKKKWISIVVSGLVTTICVVISSTPPSLNNIWANLFSNFLFGSFLAFLFFKFDLVVVTSTLFFSELITKLFVILPSENNFFLINGIISATIILIGFLIYFMSRYKKDDFVLENFGLPSHVQRISERERLKKELEIAAKVQLSLLPKEEPKINGYDISAISIPAIEAGGDYFDFVKLSGNKIGIAIGDVSGKGVGAAIYMTLTKGILQAHAEEDISPKNVLAKVNRLLFKTIEKNTFVSMFYAILDFQQHIISYARAGHTPGILTNKNTGGTKLLLSKGMALGLEEGNVFNATLIEDNFTINTGDVFVLYTDGITEAMNEKHEQFGEERFLKLIEKNRNLSSKEIINIVIKEVKIFADNFPQYDDITIIIIKRL
ncbi:MAG: SpoIIE family protein phosphatase [Melioribacteraceae bacterium]|nr:SpoIIE family protein phosphatase [Melioribacteraceae bacterium]